MEFVHANPARQRTARQVALDYLHQCAAFNSPIQRCLNTCLLLEEEQDALSLQTSWKTGIQSVLNQLGDVVELAPGQRVPSRDAIFLVRSGVILQMQGPSDESVTVQEHRSHGEGSLLNDQAFLLGEAPKVQYVADQGTKGTVIVCLDFRRALRLTDAKASLMCLFFHSLGAGLAQQVTEKRTHARSLWVAEHVRSSVRTLTGHSQHKGAAAPQSDDDVSEGVPQVASFDLGAATLYNILHGTDTWQSRRQITHRASGSAESTGNQSVGNSVTSPLDRSQSSDAGGGEGPPPLLLIANVGKQVTDDLALILCRALSDAKMIELVGVIANEAPVHDRARRARGMLDYLGMGSVPVAAGFIPEGTPSSSQDFGQHNLLHPLREGDGSDAISLMHRAYENAAERSLTLLLLSKLTEAAAFIRQYPQLFAERTARVVVMGGVVEASLTDPERRHLEGDPSAANIGADAEAARLVYSQAQDLGVPLVILTRFVPYVAPLHGRDFDELAATGHPLGLQLRERQMTELDSLWRRASRPDGHPDRQNLPPERDRTWFASTFCGNEDLGALPPGHSIWPFVSKIPTHDALATLAAHPAMLERFFQPEAKVVDGVRHCVIGMSYARGVREPSLLRSALLKGLQHALRATLKAATQALVSNSVSESKLLTVERSAWQVCLEFGLGASPFDRPQCLASVPCLVSIETHSRMDWKRSRATLFVISMGDGAHLCLERHHEYHEYHAYLRDLFPDRRSYALSAVLGLTGKRTTMAEGTTDNQAGQNNSGAANVGPLRLTVVLKATAITLEMPEGLMLAVGRILEGARLTSSSLSNLKTDLDVDVSVEQTAEAPSPGSLDSMAKGDMHRRSRALEKLSRRRSIDLVQPDVADKLAEKYAGKLAGDPIGDPNAAVDSSLGDSAAGLEKDAEMNSLSADDWMVLLEAGAFRQYQQNQTVAWQDGLLKVISGVFRVESNETHRLQAVVHYRVQPGHFVGTTALLLDVEKPQVVCDSAEGTLLYLPGSHLQQTLGARPDIAARLFSLLSTRLADQLQHVNVTREVRLDLTANAPTSVAAISANPAFWSVLHKYILSSATYVNSLAAAMDFIQGVRNMLNEPDISVLRATAKSIYTVYLAARASRPLGCYESGVSHGGRQNTRGRAAKDVMGINRSRDPALCAIDEAMAAIGEKATGPSQLRHIFDAAFERCMSHVEATCFQSFLQSLHFQYVLQLKSRERVVPTTDYFRVVKVLGEGSFGQVLLVSKRDCEQLYAMKVQKKSELQKVFGAAEEWAWDEIVLRELEIMKNLHHPLLVNLAYAFQTITHLTLVMDHCPHGDLTRFGLDREGKYGVGQSRPVLTAEQVRFIGLEVAAALLYLHSQAVLYRDLKPANLLLDAGGHARLIDFGVSRQAEAGVPVSSFQSSEYCGTRGYMPPEIHRGRPHSYPCDWFSFGVLIYELTEREVPFGDRPRFRHLSEEFRNPNLLDENGTEVPELFDLISHLLDWDPDARLGGDLLKAHKYWLGADWELVSRGRFPSPLEPYLRTEWAGVAVAGQRAKVRATPASLAGRPGEAKTVGPRVRAIENSLLSAQREQDDVDSFSKRPQAEAGTRKQSDAHIKLRKREQAMYVQGWDFVSEHALSQEYIDGTANLFSTI